MELEGYWAGMSAEQKATMDYRQLAFISGYFFDETTSRWEVSTRWDLQIVDMNDCKGCLQSAGPHTKKWDFVDDSGTWVFLTLYWVLILAYLVSHISLTANAAV